MSYNFPVEVRYVEPKEGAVVRKVGRDFKYRGGGKKGRKMPSRRPDPAKCMSGKHDWIPENIIPRRSAAHGDGPACRECRNDRNVQTKARAKALDPVAAKFPVRVPTHKSAEVASKYLELRELGYEFKEIAERIGMRRDALARSLLRSGTPR